MRVTPDRLDVAEAALEAYAEHLMQYGRAALPPRNDLRRVIEALPERSDAMSDPIKAYARAVAEATRKYLYVTQTADVPMLDEHDLQAIIATVPAPVMQHHAAPIATPTPALDPETERFARIGRLFCELWEAGAPWPVRHWTCDKHKVQGCLRCKTTTAPEVKL